MFEFCGDALGRFRNRHGVRLPLMPQSITLSAEQQEFRAAVRQFAEDKIGPRAAELDRTATYSWENFADCRAMQLPALGIPVEDGGCGRGRSRRPSKVQGLAHRGGVATL